MLQFELEDYCYVTRAVYHAWSDYRHRKGVSETPPETVFVVFAPEGRDETPLNEAEIALANWTIDHQYEQAEAVLNAIVESYDDLAFRYDDDPTDISEAKDVKTVSDLKGKIALSTIYVHPVEVDKIPYVGFQFGCDWDEEHGLGVLMHGNRCISTGGADTAFLLWLAQQDAEKTLGRSKETSSNRDVKAKPTLLTLIKSIF